MSKKLYEVEVSVVYYAYASSADEAHQFAREAIDDVYLPDHCLTRPVRKDTRLDDDWTDQSLVYGNHDGDITLGDVISKINIEQS